MGGTSPTGAVQSRRRRERRGRGGRATASTGAVVPAAAAAEREASIAKTSLSWRSDGGSSAWLVPFDSLRSLRWHIHWAPGQAMACRPQMVFTAHGFHDADPTAALLHVDDPLRDRRRHVGRWGQREHAAAHSGAAYADLGHDLAGRKVHERPPPVAGPHTLHARSAGSASHRASRSLRHDQDNGMARAGLVDAALLAARLRCSTAGSRSEGRLICRCAAARAREARNLAVRALRWLSTSPPSRPTARIRLEARRRAAPALSR